MSRSFKHSPVCTDGRNGQVIPKRIANKAVRKYKHKIANGKAYKHLFESWEIHDWTMRSSWGEAILDYTVNSFWKDKTFNFFYNSWNKYFRRK